MFDPILSIFSSSFNIFKVWLENRQQLQKAELERKLAALENQARLLRDRESNNNAWEMAQLTDADKLLRRVSFILFSAPFIIAIIDPFSVQHYFSIALASMPDWYIKTYMGIIGAVWGIASLKNIIPQIINFTKRR